MSINNKLPQLGITSTNEVSNKIPFLAYDIQIL